MVIAKEPLPGRVKTRLCPPLTPVQAAEVAGAALTDTLRAVAYTPAARRIVVLEGRPGAWLPDGVEVVAQEAGGLDVRLAGAFAMVDGPALLVGMDTPQLRPCHLASASEALGDGAEAVLGRACDGGFWAVGLRRPAPWIFCGVPMSTPATGELQLRRLVASGHDVTVLPPLRDVDRAEDLVPVAKQAPGTCFASAVERLLAEGVLT